MTRRTLLKRSIKQPKLVRAVRVLLAVSVFVFGFGFVSVQEPDLFDIEPAAADDRTTTETRYRPATSRRVLVTAARTETKYHPATSRQVQLTPSRFEERQMTVTRPIVPCKQIYSGYTYVEICTESYTVTVMYTRRSTVL